MVVKAAIEPVMPTRKIPVLPATARITDRLENSRLKTRRRVADHAVKARKPMRINVFIKWPAVQNGRVGVQFAAVLPVRTNPPPMAPSIKININENIANVRTWRELSFRANAQQTRAKTTIPARAVVIRCENSMTVFSCGAVGIASPPQVSQCWPHPSPEYDARRNTPQRITKRLNPRANQANFAKPFSFCSGILLHRIPFSKGPD